MLRRCDPNTPSMFTHSWQYGKEVHGLAPALADEPDAPPEEVFDEPPPEPVDEMPIEAGDGEEDWIDTGGAEPGFTLRPYQNQAVERIEEELYGRPAIGEEPAIEAKQSTLLVMATGLGKTVCIAEAVRRRKPGKVLMVAHRSELIYQAKGTLEALCGEPVTVEMAERYAATDHNIIVATVQTLISGMGGDGRMIAFDPKEFSLIVTDEAHHAPAGSYLKVYNYFQGGNPNLKHLGVTATPDRTDEEALGKVYNSVAMTYEIADAIHDGWLVPITAIPINVAGLDFSSIRTTAGDLNGADLANVMENEAPLHEMLQGMLEVVCNAPQESLSPILAHEDDSAFAAGMTEWMGQYPLRKTLIFAASVKHAESLCEILNRWCPGRATWVCGMTPREERKALFADYKAGRYMFLVNVGVCTEGWDEPSVECVVMARPTKSRSLYTQMAGRGTRPLPGVVDGPPTSEERKAAIAASGKAMLRIIDFVGVAGRHTLVTPADILGGNYSDEVVELAKRNINKAGRPADVDEELEKAKKELEEKKAKEAARKAKVRVGAKYTVGKVLDPFALFGVTPYRERGWERGREITPAQKAALERQKLWEDGMTFSTARQLLQGMGDRRKKNLCTYRQAAFLSKKGLPVDVTFAKAGEWMNKIAGNGWSVPADVRAEAAMVGKKE